jgi:hypothetical protein
MDDTFNRSGMFGETSAHQGTGKEELQSINEELTTVRPFGYTENEAIGRHTEIIFTPIHSRADQNH